MDCLTTGIRRKRISYTDKRNEICERKPRIKLETSDPRQVGNQIVALPHEKINVKIAEVTV